jgi:hypothetical protein
MAITGTPFGKLEEVVRNEAEKYVQGINIHVSIEELRSIEIYVIGEIDRPGLHLVPPFSSVIGGLLAGEGVKKSGSLRTIKLFRAGNLHQVIDLYSLLLEGSRHGDVMLQDGDVLFVPRLGPTAAVAGASIQPAIYELQNPLWQTCLNWQAGPCRNPQQTGFICDDLIIISNLLYWILTSATANLIWRRFPSKMAIFWNCSTWMHYGQKSSASKAMSGFHSDRYLIIETEFHYRLCHTLPL